MPAKLPGIYEFPREFRKLRTLLVQLAVDLCRPSQLRTGPFFRGFYFTGVRPVTITTGGPAAVREEPIEPASASRSERGSRNRNFRYQAGKGHGCPASPGSGSG